MLKIMYLAQGPGTGEIARGAALYRSFIRNKIEVNFTLLANSNYSFWLSKLGCDYAVLPLGESPVAWVDLLVKAARPDVFISAGNLSVVQQTNIALATKTYLLARQYDQAGAWLRAFEPDCWSKVFCIEPNADKQFYDSVAVMATPPILPVWEDDLYEPSAARAKLYNAYDRTDRGKPLMIVAHNGVYGECDRLVRQAYADGITQGYDVLPFSQVGGGLNFPDDLAKYFAGIDYLVAAPGLTYWEWLKYSRLDAKVTWYPMSRQYDDHARRIALDIDIDNYRAQPNGADMVTEAILCENH